MTKFIVYLRFPIPKDSYVRSGENLPSNSAENKEDDVVETKNLLKLSRILPPKPPSSSDSKASLSFGDNNESDSDFDAAFVPLDMDQLRVHNTTTTVTGTSTKNGSTDLDGESFNSSFSDLANRKLGYGT